MTYTTRKEVIARSLRMSGTVCFIFLVLTSNQFKTKTEDLSFWKALPVPLLISLGMSIGLALFAQIWLKKLLKAK